MKWITKINRDGDDITFTLSTGECVSYNVRDSYHGHVYLNCSHSHSNDYLFKLLEMPDKYKFYEDLGIKRAEGGDCPYCNRKDLDVLFDALLKWRPEGFKEPEKPKEEPKEPSEYDWLLN